MKSLISASLIAVMAAVAAGGASAQNIGVVASIDPNLRGTPPGSSTRTLSMGNGIFLNETIVANQTGRGQLLFNDETTLTLAPSSQVVLDTFVYDPARGNGKIGLRLTQGALRFIGGQTTKETEAVIQTPSATIGIRGSSVLVEHRNGKTIAVFLMGDRMCYGGGGGRTCTNRQGGVVGEGGFMGVASQATISAMLNRIDGAPPQALAPAARSGATRVTTDIADTVTPNSRPVSTKGARSAPRVAGTVGVKGSGTGNEKGNNGRRVGQQFGVGLGGVPPGLAKGKGKGSSGNAPPFPPLP